MYFVSHEMSLKWQIFTLNLNLKKELLENIEEKFISIHSYTTVIKCGLSHMHIA